ncbi:neuroblast differentiation-associated protein AHNAK [Pempheris klunzingeri]|uniref:neuroblast differentiation-associated protein AHNAK n=1 Tax=Pempheris klunzingeri TaxID=3127111 RepID=UPI00397FA7B4
MLDIRLNEEVNNVRNTSTSRAKQCPNPTQSSLYSHTDATIECSSSCVLGTRHMTVFSPEGHKHSGGGRRLRGPEPGIEDDSICDEPSQFTGGERPRPQGSSPVEEFPETGKYTDSDKECEAEHDPHHKSGSGKKTKKSGLGSMFEKRSTPKMSKLKEVHSPESGVIVKTAKDGCAEGLIYGGGGKDGIFIKEVVPESPASKSLKLKEGDQILSATVYFDNVSYEDAIQILEHAQAYKVKLCLKRKPDITETEPVTESDIIPEEELHVPEMREQGKTKRRGDTRISWPKFPSFGKGRKSHFTRSHSSSEADEQRKLELSPTTSDTESPIKSQDALKGKKRHKIKLSLLTKRGRISSSEDQDTETPTTGKISGSIHQTHEASDMLSPERLESPSGETPEVYVTEDVKLMEDLRPQTVQHKVELISLDSTLKTADLNVALADKESPSGIKSPDGKKKKKERSELKMKILGKDKSHKKDAKAKSSPKRLKTLGASIEKADQPGNEKSDVIPSFESYTELQGDQLAPDAKAVTTKMEMSVPKVELDISDAAFIQKSPQKGDEKTKTDKHIKQKQDTKTCPTFKLPKIGFGDIATEETIQKTNVNVEECTTQIETFATEGKEVKDDPYERLSKSSISRKQLPKREDIEIPGMEDMSKRTKAKGIKEPKAAFTGHYDENQVETVPLSIDVDSVKEAVSKLPGFKLPKVDTSGVPIPEEITVIDANAQRISVKTPTKIVDKTKQEAHFSKFDLTASPEIPKTAVKLPKIPADIISAELLVETNVDLKKPEKKYKTKEKKEIKTEIYKREDIIIPGKESTQDAALLQAQESAYESAAKFSPKESDTKSKKAKIKTPTFEISKPDIKIPKIGIDLPKQNISKGERTIFLQEVETATKKGKEQIGGVISDAKIPDIDGIEYIDSGAGSPAQKEGGIGLQGFDVNLDAAKPNADITFPEIRAGVKDVKAEEDANTVPTFGAVTSDVSVHVPDADKDINIDGAEIKILERQGKSSKFKMPNIGISMPKVKGPKIDLSPSKKDVDVTLPEAKAEVKLPEVPEVDVTLGNIDVSIPEHKMKVEKPGMEIKPLNTDQEPDGQASKFKMPKFGIKMPKIKGPELDLSLTKKGVDVTLPEAEVKFPDAEHTEPGITVVAKAPEVEVQQQDVEGSAKFKMPTFKLPKFGVETADVSGEVCEMNKDANIPEEEPVVNIKVPSIDVECPSIDIKTKGTEHEGKGGTFKMPNIGFSMPKVKGPQINLSLSKKDVDVTLPEANAEVKLPEAPKLDVSLGKADVSLPVEKFKVKTPELEIKTLQSEVQLDSQGGRFKMPTLGVSMPEVKGPEFDLSKKDGAVTLPEAKAEVKVPEVEFKEPSAKAEIKGPEIKVAAKGIKGSPSKFKMPTFKLPKFGLGTPSATADISVEVPDVDKDVKIDGADINIPEEPNIPAASFDIEGPSIDMKTTGSEQDGKGSKFKMPHFGFSMPKVKGPEIDLSLSKKDVDVTLPEAEADVKLPQVDLGKVDVSIPEAKMEAEAQVKLPEAPKIAVKPPASEAEIDGHGGKFRLPKFGIKMPKVKGPEIDLSLSKKDVDVKLPEAEADVKLPQVDLGKVDVSIPEAEMTFKKPELEMHSLQAEASLDGQKERFKMPKFGIKIPKVKGPEIDLSLSQKDADLTLPEMKTEVKLSDVPKIDASLGKAEILIPDAQAEIEKPELEIKPLQTEVEGTTFKMPKFGMSMPKVKGPEFHLGFSKKDADVTLPEAEADVNLPAVELKEPSTKVEIKAPGTEGVAKDTEASSSKFKMPSFSFSMPKVKGPDIDLSLSKKETDVLIPQEKVEVKEPEVEIKALKTEVELEGQGGKFKMPKLGITMPKVKGPEIDFSFSKKEVDVTQPEVKLPDVELREPSAMVEIKAPEIETEFDHVEGSPAKFKLPTFKLPKFGAATPNVSAEVPDLDIKVEGAGLKVPKDGARVDVEAKSIDTEGPSLDLKMAGTEGKGKESKFKVPKFGLSLPKVPEIDLSLSKKDVDVTLPEAKADVKLPEVPEIDLNLGKVDVSVPEAKMEVRKPELETEPVKFEGELDGQGSKFKMPRFGMSMPKVKAPEIDISLSKKDVEITLPEAKAEVNLPDVEEPSAKVETKAPEVQLSSVKDSPSKFKLPTFKFPKFGVATPSVSIEVPDKDKEIKIDGADMHISLPHTDVVVPEVKAEVHLPEVEVKEPSAGVVTDQQPSAEVDAKLKKPRFSLPRFSFSKPSVKAPEVDVIVPDVNVAIPEGKVEVEGGEVDMKPPVYEAEVDGQGSKFKMPKFGITMPKVTGPEIDVSLSKKDVDVTLPEAKAEVKLPDVELKKPSAEVEIKAPEIKVATKDKEASPSKFKMPTFKLPKFGVGMPSATVEVPDLDKDIKIDGADIKIPEEVLAVSIAAPSIDTEGASIDMKTTGTEHEGKGSKFKMPKFGISMPKVTGPEIDVSLSKKDVDVTLPEAKAEVKLPDVELKKPSAEVEIKAPEIKVATKDKEASPSKFKMPTFKLPKLGVGMPSATVEVPDLDKDVKIDGADIKIPEEVLAVSIAAPSIDTEGASIDMKTTGTEHEGKGSKFKMPKFGISMPKVTGPEIDVSLSKKDVDVTLPEAKAEVKLPDVELKKSAEVDIKAPELDAQTSNVEGSPSKFKMPTFKLPKFGGATPQVSVEVPDVDKDIKVDGADLKVSQTKAEVKLPDIEIKEAGGSISVSQDDGNVKKTRFSLPKFSFSKQSTKEPGVDVSVPDVDVSLPEGNVEVKQPEVDVELDGQESKFKMPKFGFSMPKVKGPEIDLSTSKKDIDVTLPEVKAEVQLPDVKTEKPSAKVEINAPEIKAQAGHVEGSPSKLKMPTFTLPKFGVATPKVSMEGPDVDKDIKVDGADLKVSQTKAEVKLPDIEIKEAGGSISVSQGDVNVKKTRFSLPKFSFSKQSTKESGVDVSVPDVDVSLPKGNVEVKQPEGDVELDGQESKFKMPKFGISMPKVTGPEIDFSKKDVDVTLPEARAEVKLPDIELKKSAEVDIKAPELDAQTSNVEGSPSKFKMPTFKLPKFGVATPQVSVEVPDVDKDIKVDEADIKLSQTKADVKLPDIEIKEAGGSISVSQDDVNVKKTRFSLPKFSFSKQSTKESGVDVSVPDVDVSLPEGNVEVKQPEVDVELDGQESKFKMPKFGFSMPKVKGPEIDLSASKKDVDLTLPEVKAEVQLPDVKTEKPSAKVEINAPEIKAQAGHVEGSPSKLKMPTFTLPKFGVATPKVSMEGPDVDKDIKIDGAKLEVPKDGVTVDVAAPSIDTEGLSVDVKAKGSELEGPGSKFKMPKFGISMPKVKGPEIDLSLSKTEADGTLPEAKAEVKLPSVEIKEPEGAISVPDAPTVEVEAKTKRPNWTFPKFSFSKAGGKAPDVDVNLEKPKVDVESPEVKAEVKAEVSLPDVEVQGPSGAISVDEPPAAELDANLRKPKFSLPRFSFSKSSVKEPEVSAELPHVDVSLPEGEVKVKQPEMEIKASEFEAEHDGQGSKFKLPKFGITLPKASQKDADITLPDIKADVKVPEDEVKEYLACVEMKVSEIEAMSKDVGGSPLKIKLPALKLPKLGDVNVEAGDADKIAETDGAKLKEDVAVNIKGPSFDIKTDVPKEEMTDSERPKTETDTVGSPSKFKLPLFKMPKLSFSRTKVDDEHVPVDADSKDQQEKEAEDSKSPKMTLTSFGELLKNIDVEFDVANTDKVGEHLETSKDVETDAASGKQLEAKEREASTKQDTTKSPERTGWFKFPRFGLSSPSEPAKSKDVKSPVDEEISPTSSVHSSDAFADISSAMTSEHVGLSLSSPTKVTVKYSDPHAPTGLEEMHSKIITSTTRTELISVEPNLPEKITILSSGVSSSSEDTLRLESGKIHVITSNIQATPDAQHATLLTAVQVQSAGGHPLKSEANEAASWTVQDSHSGKRTVFERHSVRETSSETSESKQTIVITKQFTHMFDSSEPVSGETASSIQRLRDSVHSEKMRFFDEAEK